MMKTLKFTLMAAALFFAEFAEGQITNTSNFSSGTLNATIPDGNPVGISETITVPTITETVVDLKVNLDITGGFNGDLYAYLTGPVGQFAVLLNRVGVTSGNAFGASDPGFNITLDSGGAFANVHGYTSTGFQLTGTYAPDGRNIDPQSAPAAFDSASTAANLSQYNYVNPSGAWTLFIADLSGGGQSTLVNWGLTVVTVPEPQTWSLLAGAAGSLLLFRRRSSR